MRNRKWFFVAYPESCKIDDALLSLAPDSYAWILHDRDVDADGVLKKPHYHVYLEFDNVRESSVIAQRFGVSENNVEKCTSKKGALRYLIHADDLDKYQYSIAEVHTKNIEMGQVLNAVTEEQKVFEILSIIQDLKLSGEEVTLMSLVAEVNAKHLYDTFRRGQHLFVSLWRFG